MYTRISRALVGAFICLAAWQGAFSAEPNYAEDRSEIENLQARYLFALDFRDPDAYASTFTEDGVLDYGAGEIKGRQAIADMVRGMRQADDEAVAADQSRLRPSTGRHGITNIVVKIDGDRAVACADWVASRDNPAW